MDNLTAIIPFRNGHSTIQRLLDSLPKALPVLIVDDVSEPPLQFDPFQMFLSGRGTTLAIRRDTRGYFAGAVNTGLAHCATDVLVLNQDIWFSDSYGESDALFKLILEKRGEFALIGDGVFGHPAFPQGYVQGTAMFMRRDAIERVGLLNERDYPLWGATAEWQWRMCRAGFRALPIRMQEYDVQHARGKEPFGSSIQQALAAEPDKQNLFVRTPPAISVIITCHNYGRFLRDAVNSLLGGETALGIVPPQTFHAFEILIVDDASTDETKEIGESLADDWKGIRYLRLDRNVGSAAAANAGIANAFGKYVTVLDADDMMAPTRLETLYRAAEENPHRVICDDCLEFARDRGVLEQAHPSASVRPWIEPRGEMFTAALPMPAYDFDRILTRNGMHKGILYPRAAWKESGGYPEEFRDGREDWAINIALGVKGYCGVNVHEPLYLRRQHGDNRHLRNTTTEWREQFLGQLRTRFANIYQGERPMACCGKKSNGNAPQQNITARGMALRGRFSMGTIIAGQDGFKRLEYLLKRSGSQVYIGSVTGATYVFGGKRTLGYVDPRDVPAFLNLLEGHEKVFRLAEQVPAPPQAPETVPTVPQAEGVININRADGISLQEASDAGGVLAQFRTEQHQEPSVTGTEDKATSIAPKPEADSKPSTRKTKSGRKPVSTNAPKSDRKKAA